MTEMLNKVPNMLMHAIGLLSSHHRASSYWSSELWKPFLTLYKEVRPRPFQSLSFSFMATMAPSCEHDRGVGPCDVATSGIEVADQSSVNITTSDTDEESAG